MINLSNSARQQIRTLRPTGQQFSALIQGWQAAKNGLPDKPWLNSFWRHGWHLRTFGRICPPELIQAGQTFAERDGTCDLALERYLATKPTVEQFLAAGRRSRFTSGAAQ